LFKFWVSYRLTLKKKTGGDVDDFKRLVNLNDDYKTGKVPSRTPPTTPPTPPRATTPPPAPPRATTPEQKKYYDSSPEIFRQSGWAGSKQYFDQFESDQRGDYWKSEEGKQQLAREEFRRAKRRRKAEGKKPEPIVISDSDSDILISDSEAESASNGESEWEIGPEDVYIYVYIDYQINTLIK
jgi:hypothetical protein